MSTEKPARRSVELFNAFAFICTTCGDRNYVDGVNIEDPELKAELDAQSDDGLQGEYMAAPASVTCKCGAKFDTEHDCQGEEWKP